MFFARRATRLGCLDATAPSVADNRAARNRARVRFMPQSVGAGDYYSGLCLRAAYPSLTWSPMVA